MIFLSNVTKLNINTAPTPVVATTSTLSTNQPSFTVNTEYKATLISMGFDADAATDALLQSKNDFNKALTIVLPNDIEPHASTTPVVATTPTLSINYPTIEPLSSTNNVTVGPSVSSKNKLCSTSKNIEYGTKQ